MTEKDEKRPINVPGYKGGIIKKDLAIFAFFLILSFFFWYLNSLSKEAVIEILYPVSYINPPSGKELVDEPTMMLNLFLKGTGYSALKLKLSSNKPSMEIDLSKTSFKRVPGSKTADYFIISSGITQNLTSQLRSDCDITSIKPDTLFFSLAAKTSNRAPVNSDNKAVKK